MPVNPPDSGLESLEHRYEMLGRVLPYLLIVVPLLPYKFTQDPSTGAFLGTVGLAAGAAAWTALLLGNPRARCKTWLMRLYLAGAVVFMAALTLRTPWYAFYTWIGFLHAFQYLRGAWRWSVIAVVTVIFAAAQSGGFHRPTVALVVTWLVLAAVDALMVGAFMMLGHRSAEQNQTRKGMIAELAEANERLEQVIATNKGLQAQLLAQAREAGVLEERQRLAREIHDTLAQGLAGIITQLEAAELAGGQPGAGRRIGNAKALARDSLAEARRSVQALAPSELRDARLPDALSGVAARWADTSGLAAEVMTTGDARQLHPEVEATLLRVTQEALANVDRHAAATHAWVTLSYMEDVVTVDVRDDGCGFTRDGTAAAKSGGGFGLTAMRQRVQRLAGRLDVESEPGTGTVISATVPAVAAAPQAPVPGPPAPDPLEARL